jgi:DNA-binding PadR family transcriptional regulator
MSDRDARRQARHDQQNDPPLLIMTSLLEGPKHGYALLGDIESFARVRLGPGTLYGAIGRLEARGLIAPAAPTGRTRPYQLTAAGRAVLEARLDELSTIVGEGRTRLRGAGVPAEDGAEARKRRRTRALPGDALGGTA